MGIHLVVLSHVRSVLMSEFRHPWKVVDKHLYETCLLSTYNTWYLHGEDLVGQSSNSCPVEKEKVAEEEMPDFDWDAYAAANFGLHADPYEQVVCEEQEVDMGKRYAKYSKLAGQQFHPASESISTLGAIVELHNLKKTHKSSGHCMDSLLIVLGKWLPGNNFPKNYDSTKAMLKDLGMECKFIHVCPNHCMLYHNANKNLQQCRVCQDKRFKEYKDSNGKMQVSKEPMLVLRYFPLGPRIAKVFFIPWITTFMDWHNRAAVSPCYMRHSCDSPQWRRFKEKFLDFAAEGRNVYLGISTDGFNPHGHSNQGRNCWPLISVVYNLPLSLCSCLYL